MLLFVAGAKGLIQDMAQSMCVKIDQLLQRVIGNRKADPG